MCHLWANVKSLDNCAIYGQMWHFWANVTLLGKCNIIGQMCHLWVNVTFLGKCAIFGQMCHLWANVSFMGKCAICGQFWDKFSMKFKYLSDSIVQHISWQGCSLFWFSHLSGKVIDLWLSDRRIKWAAATNKQRVLFMSVSNFYCYSYKSELTMHRTHIEQIRWSSPKHRQGHWKLEEFGWANPELSQKVHLYPLQ